MNAPANHAPQVGPDLRAGRLHARIETDRSESGPYLDAPHFNFPLKLSPA